MASTLPNESNCCRPHCDDSSGGSVPGPKGDKGDTGAAGAAGLNSTTLTTASFIQPAVSSSVSVAVVVSSWATAGQIVFVQGGGDYKVDSVPDSTHMVLINLGYPNNSAPTTVVQTSSSISPSGQRGQQGASGASVTLNSLSPTTTRGDVLVDNGANNPNASVVRMAAGADGTVIASDSAQPSGRKQVAITQNSETDNVIPRFNAAGNTTPTPLQNSSLLITDDGAIQSTPTGGDARGSKAIDLQVERTADDQVASGANAVITGGKKNKASGDYSTVGGGDSNVVAGTSAFIGGGVGNIASGVNASVVAGNTNIASGLNSSVIGGFENLAGSQDSSINGGSGNFAHGTGAVISGGTQNEASGVNSSILGGNQAVANKSGQSSFSNGPFSVPGDCQWSRLLLRNTTADATPTVLFLDGASALPTIPNNTTWGFKGMIVGRSSAGVGAAYEVVGAIRNNAGTTVLVGSVTVGTAIADGGWPGGASVTFTADDINDALQCEVVGAAATNIHWGGYLELMEVG